MDKKNEYNRPSYLDNAAGYFREMNKCISELCDIELIFKQLGLYNDVFFRV